MSFVDDCTVDQLHELIATHCNIFAQDLNELHGVSVTIYINHVILNEIVLRARSTVKLFDIKDEEINHYKDAALLCYWIRKLKPIRVESPKSVVELIRAFGEKVDEISLGKLSKAEEDGRLAIEHPINEQVAVDIAADLIVEAHEDIIKNNTQVDQLTLDSYRSQMDVNHNQFLTSVDSMLLALRYYNYSPVSISNMLESAFNTTYG